MTEDRGKILAAYAGLRVADVRDGLDTLGMHHLGSMSPGIRPLWRTRARGIARTVRYVSYDGEITDATGEQYWQWVDWYYKNVCTYPWVAEIEDGDFIVIDQSGIDAGLMGSSNSLKCVQNGTAGFVTNGGVRDSDEVIAQRVPFWSALVSQSMVQGRLKFDGANTPVCVGGVTVSPGDVVVADGDGVIAVPGKISLEVARYADAERRRDVRTRRRLYEQLGMELDESVRQGQEEKE